jgi:hypothetical protein
MVLKRLDVSHHHARCKEPVVAPHPGQVRTTMSYNLIARTGVAGGIVLMQCNIQSQRKCKNQV